MRLDSIGALFSNSWGRFQKHFAVAIQIYLIPGVLLLISQLLISRRTASATLLGVVIELLAIFGLIMASIALISLFGKGTNLGDSYRTGFKLFWASIWISILVSLAYVGGIVMLIIPGIMLAIQLSLSNFTLVVEGKHGISALALSREYIKGYWWAFVGRALLLSVCILALMLVLFLPATILLGFLGGQIVYVVVSVFFAPFAVAYQYEIYENLRRLKPDAAEAAAKAERGFLKVAMVVGIIGGIGLLVLFAFGIAYDVAHPGNSFSSPGNNYPSGMMPGGQGGAEQIEISPVSGSVGTWITLNDSDSFLDFDATNTILMKGLVAARDVVPSADGTLGFTVPATLAPNCNPSQACPQFLLSVTSGDYDISVVNADGTVDAGNFYVTGAPAADGSD